MDSKARFANAPHLFVAQLGEASPDARLGYGYDVVQIDHGGRFQPILHVERYFRSDPSNRGRNGSHGDLRKVPNGLSPREHENRARLVRRGELIQADLAAL